MVSELLYPAKPVKIFKPVGNMIKILRINAFDDQQGFIEVTAVTKKPGSQQARVGINTTIYFQHDLLVAVAQCLAHCNNLRPVLFILMPVALHQVEIGKPVAGIFFVIKSRVCGKEFLQVYIRVFL